jgi:hypothetical protein
MRKLPKKLSPLVDATLFQFRMINHYSYRTLMEVGVMI